MQLIRRILFLIITVICVISNAMADCASGKITLKDGRQFVETVNLKKCENVGALISDKKASTFKLSCNKTKFKCVAHICPNNLAPDKNGICSKSNNSEQQRFHKNLITHTYQKRNFFDACIDFKAENKTVLETQSEIKELGRKIKYACITDFSGYELSTSLAIGLIERYNWSNGIGQILASNCTTQQNNRFKSGGGHSIRCMSENGVFVEFLFGKMDSLITSREAVAGAVCPVFGFQHLDSNGNQHRCHSKKSFKDMAAFIRQHELMDIKNVNNGYFEVIPLRKDLTKTDELSKILDTDIFKNIVTHATAHIKILLKKYITDRLKSNGYEIESIKFYSARSDAFYTSDNTVWPVEIFACKKNNCKTYIKLFKFRSLKGSPGADLHVASWTALGVEHMSCIMKDGLFDSKHCFFLEEDLNNEKKQCSSTNDLIQSTFAKPNSDVKAEFDPEDNMCVLKTSEKNAKTVKRLEIAAQVGMLVITTIATAGAGSAVAIGLAAGGLLADGVALAADVEMSKASVKFLKLSTRCYDATCAKKYFEEEFKHMLQLIDRISEEEFNVVDSEMERLVKLLDDKYIGDTYAKGLENLKKDTTGILKNMSAEEVIETAATIVSLALSVANATKGVKALVSKSKTRAPKFLKRLEIRINQCPTCKKAKVDDLLKERQIADARKTSKAVSKTDDVVKSSKKTAVALDNAADTGKNISRIENGTSFGRWKFDVVTDNSKNIKYYERVIGDDLDMAKGLATNMAKDFEQTFVLVYEADNKYVVAVFDNIDDLNIFKKSGVNVVSVAEVSKSAKIAETAKSVKNADPIADSNPKSFSQIDEIYTQQASQDVLQYQNSQNMGAKAAAYNDTFRRAKETLSPEDYESFEIIADFEASVQKQERTLEMATQNLQQNGFGQKAIDQYLGDRQEILKQQRMQLRQIRNQHPQAAKFMDNNYASIMDAKSVDIDSDYIYNIQKKINVTNELSKHVDDKKLFENVKQFKDDLVAGFTPDMYKKAKNWDNLSGPDKANFMVNDLIPYIQNKQGLGNTKIDVHLMPASHIGGNAAFCTEAQCFQVSFEALDNMPFERLMSTLSHEAIHAGQYIEGGRSVLSKDLIKVADNNYVEAVLHSIQANRANAVEREAYMATDGMFSNFLNEVAKYHNW